MQAEEPASEEGIEDADDEPSIAARLGAGATMSDDGVIVLGGDGADATEGESDGKEAYEYEIELVTEGDEDSDEDLYSEDELDTDEELVSDDEYDSDFDSDYDSDYDSDFDSDYDSDYDSEDDSDYDSDYDSEEDEEDSEEEGDMQAELEAEAARHEAPIRLEDMEPYAQLDEHPDDYGTTLSREEAARIEAMSEKELDAEIERMRPGGPSFLVEGAAAADDDEGSSSEDEAEKEWDGWSVTPVSGPGAKGARLPPDADGTVGLESADDHDSPEVMKRARALPRCVCVCCAHQWARRTWLARVWRCMQGRC